MLPVVPAIFAAKNGDAILPVDGHALVDKLTKRVHAVDRNIVVAKTVDPVDARSALISLTPAGRRLLESAMLPHFNRVSDFAKTLSSAERETMIALLKKLVAGH